MTRETTVDAHVAARRLLDGLLERPWGEISASVYETARLIVLAPWLRGHSDRIRFLLDSRRDGAGWGQPDGYDLVPTLSATEAALAVLLREESAPSELVGAADRGLRVLAERLGDATTHLALPDTPAIEIIVPALVTALNSHLDRLRDVAVPGLAQWASGVRLGIPSGLSDAPIAEIRSRLHNGLALPPKLLHSLEVAAPLPATSAVRAIPPGTLGASPAATVAWLATSGPAHRDPAAVRYLEELVDEHKGAVPSVTPISVFERAWVLSWIAGMGVPAPPGMVEDLRAALGPYGTPGGAGLPPDADTTSVVLTVLERLGDRQDLDCLMSYEADGHFQTWPGERTPSVSTNAHVLDALAARLAHEPGQNSRYGPARDRVVEWLCGQQHADGSWTDKWHASPLYATACCVLALSRYGTPPALPTAWSAVRRAVSWVLRTQRADGSWGRWAPNREETAYALHILLRVRDGWLAGHPLISSAVERGRAFLLEMVDAEHDAHLWHDKDLYVPGAVVRASVLAALHRSDTRVRTSTLPDQRRLSTM